MVTGGRGRAGVPVASFLRSCGYEVAGFDRAAGADVLDLAAVRRAARGCAAIVHLAALAHDSIGRPGADHGGERIRSYLEMSGS